MGAKKGRYIGKDTTEAISKRLLRLPFHNEVSDDNIEYVKVISDRNSSKNYGDSASPKNYNLGS